MSDAGLINFPLPMMTSFLCGLVALLIWTLDLGTTRAKITFSVLFALCALETFLVGMRFGYGLDSYIPLQRILPLFLGPLMYLGFLALTLDRPTFLRSAMIHLTIPLVALGVFWLFVRDLRQLDWVISASYLCYLVALIRLWRRGADGLIYARMETSQRLLNWMLRMIGLLLFILVMDSAIAVDFTLHHGANVPLLISYGTIPLLLILLIILLTIPRLLPTPRHKPEAPGGEGAQDQSIMGNLKTLMDTEKLYLDPDMTVQRLAKRLHLPAKVLSGAVNRTQQKNVSQFVNDLRLAHATDLLRNSTDNVTKIAAQSGFMARSNFYREFQRVHGQSPNQFRATHAGNAPHSPSAVS